MSDIIRALEKDQMRSDVKKFNVGDTIKVHYRIIEGTRERVQVFEGTVVKIQGGGSRQTFTVRRISYGVGVERTFLMHSPRIADITLVRKGRVRRSKLYYLRDRQGKAAKVKEKTNY
ncbi:50S ribosomal protein L19 [Peptoniphilus sp. GNH]|nr:ribosomal protein L19 [Clostridiales bacterium KA00134]UHR03063.1 50S ribosomal protein L19 [Peptoniphilus sp. GNH]